MLDDMFVQQGNRRPSRREFLKSVSLGTTAALVAGCLSRPLTCQNSKRLPNLVVIFTDDQGYGDVGCYGATGFSTPNLDGMAERGMCFTNFYSAAPVCTPSRAALMTGCYPMRVGLPSVLGPRSKQGIKADETTLAELLKRRGYATACFGKWHLGHHREFLPLQHGFDEYFGLPYSNDMKPRPNALGPKSKHPPLPLIEGNEVIGTSPDQTQLTTWYTERAVDFIERCSDRPFFLYVPHAMPHVPLHVSDKYENSCKRGLFGDVIQEIDWSVGKILSTLKRTGVEENTLVVFTSDNGPWLAHREHAGSAGPLREGKATTFEGGMRIPCIMQWPGRVPAGSVCEEMATTMDILPTMAGLAEAPLPPSRDIDGKDIFPLMSGTSGARTPHEAFFYYKARELQAVRSGKWKLHLRHQYRECNKAQHPNERLVTKTQAILEQSLFDLASDIGETTDVSAQHPEVVKRLLALIDNAREDLGDGKNKGKGARPCGIHE